MGGSCTPWNAKYGKLFYIYEKRSEFYVFVFDIFYVTSYATITPQPMYRKD